MKWPPTENNSQGCGQTGRNFAQSCEAPVVNKVPAGYASVCLHLMGPMVGSVMRPLSDMVADFRNGFGAMSLSRQFVITATLIMGIAMLVLGSWVSQRMQEGATRSAAESGAVFLQSFLQPHIQDLDDPSLTQDSLKRRLDSLFANALFSDSAVRKHFVILKVWRLDKSLAYVSSSNFRPSEIVEREIAIAASGHIATGFEDLDEMLVNVKPEDNVVLLEVYAPLYQIGSNKIIAVGEFYQSGAWLIEERRNARNSAWATVGATGLMMLAGLFLIVSRGSATIDRQRLALEEEIAHVSALAAQNKSLRRVADQARVNASEANEYYLAQLGADIHDGPLQILSLLMLSLGSDGQDLADDRQVQLPDSTELAKKLHSELRELSSGLVLPGIQEMQFSGIIEAAVRRHQDLTATAVTVTLGPLPDHAAPAVMICCYRVIQEALNNAYRHAGGEDQHVHAESSGSWLTLVISDGGTRTKDVTRNPKLSSRIGVPGMRMRIEALKGTLEIKTHARNGTKVIVRLPLDPVDG